jgi:NADPH:quinone reductase-like Zn-dependent oxidoreductase
MKGLVLHEVHQKPLYQELERPTIGENEVLVKLKAAALNHRDVYITEGLYPGIVTPVVLGSDGAGIVCEIGSGVDVVWKNKAVMINPSIGWEHNTVVQPMDYSILGMPTNGCFAEYVKIKVEGLTLVEKPVHLTWGQAAALPLAGLTAYRALFTKAQLKTGERVLISGVGGGVALLACQFAIAKGAEVWVTSGSTQKIEQAIALGAKGGVNYKEEGWHRQLMEKADGAFDVIIDSAGGDGFKRFLDVANMGARIAFYGGTRGSFVVSPQKMFWKQITMYGSTMGSSEEFGEMVAFVSETKLQPVVDSTWTLENGAAAFDHLASGQQFGKVVLEIED